MIELIEPVEVRAIEASPTTAQPLVAQQAPARQLTVVEYAMQRGATAAEVRELVELQIQMDNHKREMRKLDDEREREMRAESARTAYYEAMAAFKAEAVRVIRSKDITDGPLKGKKHADLYAVTLAATEALSKHGLSASWETLEDAKDWIRIACRVKHVAGYSEAVPFGGPVDTGPGRNAIQARKSTITYLERFTMLMALGLAESDADDDGRGSGINELLATWTERAEGADTLAALDRVYKEGSAAFTKAKDVPGFAAFGRAVATQRRALKEAGNA
jgi:hypothetical protein